MASLFAAVLAVLEDRQPEQVKGQGFLKGQTPTDARVQSVR